VPTSDQAIDGAVPSSTSFIFGRPITGSPSSVSCIDAWMLLVTCRLRSAVGIHLRIESIMASIHPLRAKALSVAAPSSSTARAVTASLAPVL